MVTPGRIRKRNDLFVTPAKCSIMRCVTWKRQEVYCLVEFLIHHCSEGWRTNRASATFSEHNSGRQHTPRTLYCCLNNEIRKNFICILKQLLQFKSNLFLATNQHYNHIRKLRLHALEMPPTFPKKVKFFVICCPSCPNATI